ncbi:MAG: hypothetical protein WCC75_10065, partial [Desulfobaccales bacterium]
IYLIRLQSLPKTVATGILGKLQLTLNAPEKQKGRGFLSPTPKLPYLLKIGQYAIITAFSLC